MSQPWGYQEGNCPTHWGTGVPCPWAWESHFSPQPLCELHHRWIHAQPSLCSSSPLKDFSCWLDRAGSSFLCDDLQATGTTSFRRQNMVSRKDQQKPCRSRTNQSSTASKPTFYRSAVLPRSSGFTRSWLQLLALSSSSIQQNCSSILCSLSHFIIPLTCILGRK